MVPFLMTVKGIGNGVGFLRIESRSTVNELYNLVAEIHLL